MNSLNLIPFHQLLYLLSPSAKKSHGSHDTHHGSSAHEPKHAEPVKEAEEPPKEPEPVLMKDDEGTVADVTESIKQAEVSFNFGLGC